MCPPWPRHFCGSAVFPPRREFRVFTSCNTRSVACQFGALASRCSCRCCRSGTQGKEGQQRTASGQPSSPAGNGDSRRGGLALQLSHGPWQSSLQPLLHGASASSACATPSVLGTSGSKTSTCNPASPLPRTGSGCLLHDRADQSLCGGAHMQAEPSRGRVGWDGQAACRTSDNAETINGGSPTLTLLSPFGWLQPGAGAGAAVSAPARCSLSPQRQHEVWVDASAAPRLYNSVPCGHNWVRTKVGSRCATSDSGAGGGEQERGGRTGGQAVGGAGTGRHQAACLTSC